MDRIFDVRLFTSFKLSTEVLNLFAIEYKVSLGSTVYTVCEVGICNCWPIERILVFRKLKQIRRWQ